MLDLLQMEELCCSKLSSESIKIPSKVSFVLVLIEATPIDNQLGFWNSKVNDIFLDWLQDHYTGTTEKVCQRLEVLKLLFGCPLRKNMR